MPYQLTIFFYRFSVAINRILMPLLRLYLKLVSNALYSAAALTLIPQGGVRAEYARLFHVCLYGQAA